MTITIKNNNNLSATEKLNLINTNVLNDIEHRNRNDEFATILNGKVIVIVTMKKGKGGIKKGNAHKGIIRGIQNEILGLAHIHTKTLSEKEINEIALKLNLNTSTLHVGGLVC